MDYRIRPFNYHPLSAIHTQSKVNQKNVQKDIAFKDVLETAQQSSNLKLSKHAEKRLKERNITIDHELWSKMEQKVKEAKEKGVNDSLIVTDDAAFIVSAKNNTIITAMAKKEASAQIFTNINGTIIIP